MSGKLILNLMILILIPGICILFTLVTIVAVQAAQKIRKIIYAGVVEIESE